ncbi:MAG TPA: D-amino acid aminotransferase [Casimicrobium sp.]|nr:D-amino acid aminotransferase [Casimicrobium sp.]
MIFLNGAWMPIEEAKVSVLDRGFIYGDGVYEYVPVIKGKPYRLEQHLIRLDNSCKEIGLKNPYTNAQWTKLVHEIVAKNGTHDQGVYWQITRGVAKRDHSFPVGVEPTVFMMSNPLPKLTQEQIDNGVPCYTFPDTRWHRCHIKSISLLGNVLAKQHASEQGGAEVVMLRDGFLTEAAASNVFCVFGDTIVSAPKDHHILGGITLDAVVDHAAAAGMKLEVRPVSEAEMWAADEMWLSSSSKGVLAITTLDDKPIGNAAHKGKPGPVFKKMFALVQADLYG